MLPAMVTTRLLKLCAAFCLLLAVGAGSGRAQVLVIHSVPNASYAVDVQTKLVGTGRMGGPVDLFDAKSNDAPTLTFLQQYAAVLVFSDSVFQNPSALGNVLADFVDAGGGVVQAAFTNFGSWSLSGRWESEFYNPAELGNYAPSSGNLGTIVEPNSPLLDGVTTLQSGGTYYAQILSLRSGARLVASWDNGIPLVVVNGNLSDRVLMVNLYPPSSDALGGTWPSSTDGAILLANALNFVAIPEPSTYALLALGVGVIVWLRRRR